MITWTLTAGVEPEHAVSGSKFVEVSGESDDPQSPHQDPHDARYFPNQLTALAFLISHKAKRGDVIHVAGEDTGRILRVGYRLDKQAETITFDVGSHIIEHPAALIEWLNATLKPGDTVVYLPIETAPPESNDSPDVTRNA